MTREEFIRKVESNQRAFQRFLVALCCGDSALAEDIAQESLMRAYLACDSLRDSGRFRSCIYRIGFNTFINYRRSRVVAVDYDQAREVPAADLSDDSFRYQELYAALDKIPERERTSILLYYMEEYSTKEISEIVNVPEGTVRQHISCGRIRLREILKR